MSFYRASPSIQKGIRKHVDDMLENDVIEPSNYVWHSPVVMAKKRYRKQNNVTVPLSFPLPLNETAFEAVEDAKPVYFSNLDLRSSFWQIKMSDKSNYKATLITREGIYNLKRMRFWLMYAPISFQTVMTHILRGINFKFCLVYVDDILVSRQSFEDHTSHFEQAFFRLGGANLKVNPEKCDFINDKIKYLGFILSFKSLMQIRKV